MTNPTPRDSAQLPDAFDERDFYELMQAYRFANMADQSGVVTAFEAVKGYARAALRAQAATAPNLACKSAQARLATQWGYVRAASVEPVGSVDHVEWSASKEQWRHNIWADKKIPFGTKLYAGAPPAHVPADADPLRSLLAALKQARTAIANIPASLGYEFTHLPALDVAIAKAESATPRPQAVAASSPAQAVDAVDSRSVFEAWVMKHSRRPGTHIERSHNGVYKDNRVAAKWSAWDFAWNASAALAARQPQAQQGGGEGAGEVRGHALAGHIAGVKFCQNLIKNYTDEARGLLDEAHRFSAVSPKGQQNISAAMNLLDDIDQAAALATKESQ